MTANINPETGIRYGTIYLNSLDGDTAAWLFYEGTNLSEEEAWQEAEALEREIVNELVESGKLDEDEFDSELDRRMSRINDSFQIEEPTIEGTCDGVEYLISWLGGAPLLWVIKSPFTTHARLCSPCVPNAGDLESLDESGYECYDVPPDWRRKDAS